MKLHTLTIITAAVTVALAQRATADGFQGTTTEFSKVNVSLKVEYNKPFVDNGNTTVYSTDKAKIDNKTILNLFAAASGADTNEWRNNAQLIFDWSTYQMAVADKTGTNILLYLGSATGGVNSGGVQASFDVDWFNNYTAMDWGAYKENNSDRAPGSDKWTLTSQGLFQLFYDDGVAADKIALSGVGPNKEQYKQNWDMNYSYTSWTEKEQFKPYGASESEIFEGTNHSTVSGNITANGKGSGINDYLYTP